MATATKAKKNPLNGKVLIDSASANREALEEFRVGIGDNPPYVVEKGTEDYVHFECDQINFDSLGNKRGVPWCQIVPYRQWAFMRKFMVSQGYTYIKILHAPLNDDCRLLLSEKNYQSMKAQKQFVFPTEPDIIGTNGKRLTRKQIKALKANEKAAQQA